MHIKLLFHIPSMAMLFAVLMLVSACSQTPSSMILSPEIQLTSNNRFLGYHAAVNVSDMRTAHHLIEIIRENKAAHLVTSNTSLEQAVGKVFTASLKQSGLDVTSMSTNQLSLVINQAKVTVDQALSKYTSTSLLTLTTQLTVGESTITKTFNSKASTEGLLSADIAVLERDFNQQLGNLLAQIVQDPELLAFIKNPTQQ